MDSIHDFQDLQFVTRIVCVSSTEEESDASATASAAPALVSRAYSTGVTSTNVKVPLLTPRAHPAWTQQSIPNQRKKVKQSLSDIVYLFFGNSVSFCDTRAHSAHCRTGSTKHMRGRGTFLLQHLKPLQRRKFRESHLARGGKGRMQTQGRQSWAALTLLSLALAARKEPSQQSWQLLGSTQSSSAMETSAAQLDITRTFCPQRYEAEGEALFSIPDRSRTRCSRAEQPSMSQERSAG
ncbi:hypothetical protein EK904_009844 [Melospiza melodia maxima]|nr:hypothetical protein EK904_009844 [Melospiza melodia maxima]